MKIGFSNITIPNIDKKTKFKVGIEPLARTNDNQRYCIYAESKEKMIRITLIFELDPKEQKLPINLCRWETVII